MQAVVPVDTPIVATTSAIPESVQPWRLGTRIAFRFCAVYFTLYTLVTQMFSGLFPFLRIRMPQPGMFPPLRRATTSIATDWFGFSAPLVSISGSGDKPFDFAQVLPIAIVAAIATALWSVADRRRRDYAEAQKWFRLLLRFGLGSTLVTYGAVKAVPLQMPYPTLTRLLEPYGDFSLMGVLWAQIGSAPAYER